jgi:hypothetical protein
MLHRRYHPLHRASCAQWRACIDVRGGRLTSLSYGRTAPYRQDCSAKENHCVVVPDSNADTRSPIAAIQVGAVRWHCCGSVLGAVSLSGFLFCGDEITTLHTNSGHPLCVQMTMLLWSLCLLLSEVCVQPELDIGRCWAFPGSSGNLTVLLREPILVDKVSIDHPILSNDPAPQLCSVWVRGQLGWSAMGLHAC